MKEKIQKESSKSISGFSKLNKRGKIKWIVENFFKDPENVMHELMSSKLSHQWKDLLRPHGDRGEFSGGCS